MNYRSIRDLTQDLLTWELPPDIEVIVGIPRSGLLVANILSLHRNIPFTDLDGLLAGRMLGLGTTKKVPSDPVDLLKTPRRVLVVDDTHRSGTALAEAKQAIAAAGLLHQMMFAAVYMNPGGEHRVDFYRRILPAPRVFEWNLMHTRDAAQACWDLDGVFCRDPTPEENDDGPRYLQFLSTVPAQMRPSFPLGHIVTSRLEKYRPQTEEWLARNGIKYRNLAMLNLPNKQARVAAGCHAAFKAEVYKNTPAAIFVESSSEQAAEIARLSGKYVICFQTQECLSPGMAAEVRHECKDVLRLLKRRLRARIKRIYEAIMDARRPRIPASPVLDRIAKALRLSDPC
jgi:orotate phosphoribosyltransferase